MASTLDPINKLGAKRGDLAVIKRGKIESCGVVTSAGVAVKTLYGESDATGIEFSSLEYFPLSAIETAFKVG
ncbi:hypothetical protein E2A64_10355 [Pseudohoeflea suaedae]|uniref:DUF6950 domain-containing protein n=1 Tax=Pseudohoeflea suaedae TaxID=877384 RepID=A0A4R5PJA3_9HYPH|nr:hypothetical protein [Pseudohoeflea suaedae]TDH35729.1 hypothetical protein E2A64_10355 [Pseudohoeflea suaedae]